MRLILLLTLLFSMMGAQAALPDPVGFGIAVEMGNIEKVTQWLDEGLDPDFIADRTGTGLMIAAWEGNIPMMELFLSRGANLHKTNKYKEQALQLAAWKGQTKAVEWLIGQGAKVNRTGNEWGALHYAVFAGNKDLAANLIERGADINARTPNNSTPLMMAAREGHEDLSRFLLESGADPKLKNEVGDTAMTWAMRYSHFSIAKLISTPNEFAEAARASKAAPDSFGKATRSINAPTEVSEILSQIRNADAEGQPTVELRKKLVDAVARFRAENKAIVAKSKLAKSAPLTVPKALVITADRNKAGAERVELIYDNKGGTVNSYAPGRIKAPAINSKKTNNAKDTNEVPKILDQIKKAQAKGQPIDALRKKLYEAAIDNLKKESPEPASR